MGALANALWPTVLGAVLVCVGKLRFRDRMVWPAADMKDAGPRCRSWLC